VADEDQAAGEVAAMQFAGGMSIARIAAEWERGAEWVEDAIRRALLESIPRRDGGLKATRSEVRAERRENIAAWHESQGKLGW
jgi:hypothetical protein